MVPDGRLSRKHRGSNPPQRYRLYTNVQGGLCRAKRFARIVNKHGGQFCAFNRQRRFSPATTLDSFPGGAQDCLYTNKLNWAAAKDTI
jgi:hypothetical protein